MRTKEGRKKARKRSKSPPWHGGISLPAAEPASPAVEQATLCWLSWHSCLACPSVAGGGWTLTAMSQSWKPLKKATHLAQPADLELQSECAHSGQPLRCGFSLSHPLSSQASSTVLLSTSPLVGNDFGPCGFYLCNSRCSLLAWNLLVSAYLYRRTSLSFGHLAGVCGTWKGQHHAIGSSYELLVSKFFQRFYGYGDLLYSSKKLLVTRELLLVTRALLLVARASLLVTDFFGTKRHLMDLPPPSSSSLSSERILRWQAPNNQYGLWEPLPKPGSTSMGSETR